MSKLIEGYAKAQIGLGLVAAGFIAGSILYLYSKTKKLLNPLQNLKEII